MSRRIKEHTHVNDQGIDLNNPLYCKWIKRFTFEEMELDLASKGDITTNVLFGEEDFKVRARIIAKEDGILAGVQEIRWFLNKNHQSTVFKEIYLSDSKSDGEKIKKGDTVMKINGFASDVLKVERIILNLLQRMSGVATETRKVVDLAKKVNKNIIITPTRKTLWGLLDKKAVLVGGGGTHRLNLSDAVLIKDNHLLSVSKCASEQLSKLNVVEEVLRRLKKHYLGRFLEIEVSNMEEALKAAEILAKGMKMPCLIMLDNFSPALIAKTIKELMKRNLYDNIYLEASGGITARNVQKYAKTGIDIISMGSLTHSVKAIDMNLEIM